MVLGIVRLTLSLHPQSPTPIKLLFIQASSCLRLT
nr:MAG TPA: hypothetical protein [Crassvirales sp.]